MNQYTVPGLIDSWTMRLLILLSAVVCLGADFEREVRPILAKKCFACHGAALQKSHLRLDRRADMLRGGESGIPAVEPGKSASSLLIRYVSGTDAKLVMPPAGPRLTAAEIATLREWIDGGAVWPGAMDAAPVAKADPRLLWRATALLAYMQGDYGEVDASVESGLKALDLALLEKIQI